MLVLARKNGESVWIGGTLVKVVLQGRNSVRLAIEAPKNVQIMRAELFEQGRGRQADVGQLVEA